MKISCLAHVLNLSAKAMRTQLLITDETDNDNAESMTDDDNSHNVPMGTEVSVKVAKVS
jgi:hypothetical protein